MTQKYDRFKAAPWFQEGIKPPVLVGGAGGIGSWLTVLLNRAGFETYVFDFDVLEEINMAGQLFMHDSIGKPKVTALDEITYRLCREHIVGNNEKVTEETMTNEIVFAAFDNIKARRDMFTTWVQNYKGRPDAIFIDGRLTAEQLTIFSIKGNDELAILEYQTDELPDDSTIPELDCTLKQTSHGAAMIAAHMVEMFTNWYAGYLGRDTDRYTPYFWEYIIPIGFCNQRDASGVTTKTNEYGSVFPVVPPNETIVNIVPLDTPSLQESKEQAEDREEMEDIARSLTGEPYIGTDLARVDDNPSAIIVGTSGEFQGGEEAERMFYNPTEEPTPQPDLPGIDGRPFTINLGDEAFGVPRQPQDPLQDELQRASEELGRWADTQITNGPVPGNSILEENDGQTEQNSDL